MTILVAALTYEMGRFGTLCLWFQRIGETARCKQLQFIALLLAIPCFKLSNFCFQLAFFIQQRELLALGRKCALLGGENYGLQFNDFALNGGDVAQLQKRAGDVASRFQAAYGAANR